MRSAVNGSSARKKFNCPLSNCTPRIPYREEIVKRPAGKKKKKKKRWWILEMKFCDTIRNENIIMIIIFRKSISTGRGVRGSYHYIIIVAKPRKILISILQLLFYVHSSRAVMFSNEILGSNRFPTLFLKNTNICIIIIMMLYTRDDDDDDDILIILWIIKKKMSATRVFRGFIIFDEQRHLGRIYIYNTRKC